MIWVDSASIRSAGGNADGLMHVQFAFQETNTTLCMQAMLRPVCSAWIARIYGPHSSVPPMTSGLSMLIAAHSSIASSKAH